MVEKCGKRQSEYKSYNSGLRKRKTYFQITNFAFNTPGCFRQLKNFEKKDKSKNKNIIVNKNYLFWGDLDESNWSTNDERKKDML